MTIQPIDAISPLSRPDGIDAAQQKPLAVQQDVFEQLMMQTGFTLLETAKGDDAKEDEEE